jgi:hypothetical protein
LTLIAPFGMRENRGTGLLMRDRGRFDHLALELGRPLATRRHLRITPALCGFLEIDGSL